MSTPRKFSKTSTIEFLGWKEDEFKMPITSRPSPYLKTGIALRVSLLFPGLVVTQIRLETERMEADPATFVAKLLGL